MFDAVNKAFLVGVGLAAMAGEKIEDFTKELAEKGKLSQDEARKLADDMLARSAKARKDLQAQVAKWVDQSLHKMNLPTKEDLDRLADRISKLEEAGPKK